MQILINLMQFQTLKHVMTSLFYTYKQEILFSTVLTIESTLVSTVLLYSLAVQSSVEIPIQYLQCIHCLLHKNPKSEDTFTHTP